jgi:drug/metabolite transporter (DMT)-like permease
VVWAERTVPSSIVALLVAAEPLWIVLLDWLPPRPVRPGARVLLGLGIGFAGVVFLIAPWQTSAGAIDPIGSLVVVLASASWAAGSLYGRRAPLPRSPLATTGMQMLAGGALLTATGLGAGEAARFDPAAVSLVSVAALAYLVVFGSLIAFTAYVWLIRNAPASKVATYAYVNPVIAVVLGWALAGEPLGARTLLAAAVIIGAVALLSAARGGGRAAREAAPEAPARRPAPPVPWPRPARRPPPPAVARTAPAAVSEPEAPAA